MVTRQGFSEVVSNCFQSLGFSHDASLFEFPSNMFLPGSDLSPIEQNIDKIIYGLTQWEPSAKGNSADEPKKVSIEGQDYSDAINKMNTLFLKNSWGKDCRYFRQQRSV